MHSGAGERLLCLGEERHMITPTSMATEAKTVSESDLGPISDPNSACAPVGGLDRTCRRAVRLKERVISKDGLRACGSGDPEASVHTHA